MLEDPLGYPETPETPFAQKMMKIILLLESIAIIVCLLLVILSSGCVSAAKEVGRGIMETPTPTPTPTPEPTEEPTMEPTPTPEPTESLQSLMLRTNGYHMREWLHWYREDVQGINTQGTKDLSTWVTVYGYKDLPKYHYYSVSWARNFVVRPEPGMKFVFILINIYSDTITDSGTGDDVRQYGFSQNHFALHIDGSTYYPEDMEYPEQRIPELDEVYTYDHTGSVKPYGYKIVQDLQTGIYTAEYQEWIMGGRSNAIDGYIIFQVPEHTEPSDIKVYGSFSNLGGTAWWQLE